MADDSRSSTVESLKALDFHYIIAYILPGLVATRAVAYYFGHLAAAYQKAAVGGDGAVVPLLLLLLSALTCGLTISVLRQQFFDGLIGWFRGITGKDRPGWRPNYAEITASKEKTEAYEKAVQNVYRYYQFVANMAFAVGLLALARLERLNRVADTELAVTRGLGILAGVLLIAAISQFSGWCRVHNQICRSPSRADLKRARSTPSGSNALAAPTATALPPTTTASPDSAASTRAQESGGSSAR